MAELQEYKCPRCGGALEFDSTSQKLVCPYCESEYEISDFPAPEEAERNAGEDSESFASASDEFHWDARTPEAWDAGEDGMRVYICRSCGGEIIGDESLSAAKCPYCGNNVVVPANFSGTLRPDLVIPFQLDRNAAVEALQRHLSDKKLLPQVFKTENHIQEIRGIYVPFWLYDAEADADIRYHATRVRRWSDSSYNYKETRHYRILRSGTLSFEAIPADGSSKMADDLMESLEPYDLSAAVDFRTAYLAGFMADKYDVSAEANTPRANKRIKSSTEYSFRDTVVGYESITTEDSTIRVHAGRIRYALYPVWLLLTEWQGQTYTFAMNGQTGKFVGDLPMDKGAYWRWFGTLAAIGGAISYAIAAVWHFFL